MDAPALKKGTDAEVSVQPSFDLEGAPCAIVIVKQRFHVDRDQHVTRAPGAEVRPVDVPWEPDAKETSSTRFPSDVCLGKPGTDVIVAGSAVAPFATPQRELDVLVRVGPVQTALHVTGPRVYYRSLLGRLTVSDPEPFERVALKWELAYGGMSAIDGEPLLEEARNPVGRGVAHDFRTLIEQPAPQIEDAVDRCTSERAVRPAGVGAIARHWAPRRSFFGTADAQWRKERMPLYPLDFDPRFFHAAPPEMCTAQPLRGGERVQILHMNEIGPLDFELPRLVFFVGSRQKGALLSHRAPLDTVLLEPNSRDVELTWRAIVPLPERAHEIDYVQVHEKELS